MDKYTRYLKIIEWAKKRYTKNGVLITYIGLEKSIYTRIENLAAIKILGITNLKGV
jgi:hypothetical protein